MVVTTVLDGWLYCLCKWIDSLDWVHLLMYAGALNGYFMLLLLLMVGSISLLKNVPFHTWVNIILFWCSYRFFLYGRGAQIDGIWCTTLTWPLLSPPIHPYFSTFKFHTFCYRRQYLRSIGSSLLHHAFLRGPRLIGHAEKTRTCASPPLFPPKKRPPNYICVYIALVAAFYYIHQQWMYLR